MLFIDDYTCTCFKSLKAYYIFATTNIIIILVCVRIIHSTANILYINYRSIIKKNCKRTADQNVKAL